VEERLREKEREKREAKWARIAAPVRKPGHRDRYPQHLLFCASKHQQRQTVRLLAITYTTA